MWAMRADNGSKMLAATVQVGCDSTWRNRSRACDIWCPPSPLGSCAQSNRTTALFFRDLNGLPTTTGDSQESYCPCDAKNRNNLFFRKISSSIKVNSVAPLGLNVHWTCAS